MPAVPKLQSRYELKDALGHGGMGMVFTAWDTILGREVAIKMLKDYRDKAALDLFRKECGILASLSHPNIVEIFDIGDSDDQRHKGPYFVMPRLRGVTLDNLISESSERLPVERVVDIIAQACRGLHAAHEKGLVHRDLKPSNIFILEDDSVKIIDFGVAHMVDHKTSIGLKGTLVYMSPEQLMMQKPTPLSDLFSIAVVCYEALTRRRPFDGASRENIAQAVLHYNPPPAHELNPSVTPLLSQVVHKAMAKQPLHRFSSTREFAATLYKALNNEPIEYFNPNRIEPRIQRARTAFLNGEFDFASDILTELEAEGYLHPEIAPLRNQINQASREKTISQLLETASRRFQDEEYQIALQKVQEVLTLDPANTDAHTLKARIEDKRRSDQVEEWFRLAAQHVENNAFSHARQALNNVLDLKPKDTRALQMLSEIDRQEQQYNQLRGEKDQVYEAALEAWRKGEVSVALTKIERVLELDRRAPDVTSPERAASFQSLYNQVRSEYDRVQNGFSQARKLFADGSFAAALTVCAEFLAKYPGHALFQALKFDIEERQRQERSAYVARISREVDAEPDLNRRISIVEDALQNCPDESHFKHVLQLLRSKRELVELIVSKARGSEEQGHYSDALGQWEILRNIYGQYPGLDFEIERLRRRRHQQALAEAKSRWLDRIEHRRQLGDFESAVSLCREAAAEFPNDPEIAALERSAGTALQRATQARALLEEGQELAAEGRVTEGLDRVRAAYQMDPQSMAIRSGLLDALLKEAGRMLDEDWQGADVLVQEALELDPGHALAKSLRALVQDRKQAEYVTDCLSKAREAQASGEFASALSIVDQGLGVYPKEPRLLQFRQGLKKNIAESERMEQRRKDYSEMRTLYRSAESAEVSQLESIFVRTRLLAEGHRADEEIQRLATEVGALVQRRQVPVERDEAGERLPDRPARRGPLVRAGERLSLLGDRMLWGWAGFRRRFRTWQEATRRNVTAVLTHAENEPKKPLDYRAILYGLLATIGTILLGAAVTWWITERPDLRKEEAALYPLRVQVEPAGAAVRIFDAASKEIPVSRAAGLPQGEYRIVASLEGHKPQTSTIRLGPGLDGIAKLVLSPVGHTLRLTTDMENVSVLLDAQPLAALESGQFVTQDLPGGEHSLQLKGQFGMEASVGFQVSPSGPPELTSPVVARNVKVVVISSAMKNAHLLASYGPVKVRVDDEMKGELTSKGFTLDNLSPGLHKLTIEEPGEKRDVPFEIGAAPALDIAVSSDRNVGSLVVDAGGEDAVIFLDDKLQKPARQAGKLVFRNLVVRPRRVRVERPGYFAAEQRVALRKGEQVELKFDLKPVPRMARFTLRNMPADMSVSIADAGTHSAGPGGLVSLSVAPGERLIRLTRPGYEAWEMKREFTAGKDVEIDASAINLVRSPGRLQVNVTPPSARISVIRRDGTRSRIPYSPGMQLPEGEYEVEATESGYVNTGRNIRVEPGKLQQVDIALARIPEAPPPPPPNAMTLWVNAGAWSRQADWYVHEGAGVVLYAVTPKGGVFEFQIRCSDRFGGCNPRILVDYRDSRNYVEYEIEKSKLNRKRVVDGNSRQSEGRPHRGTSGDAYGVRLTVRPQEITFEIRGAGGWQAVDRFASTEGVFTDGRFALDSKREVRLKDFSYKP
jgi:serine/threonine-protein kinase